MPISNFRYLILFSLLIVATPGLNNSQISAAKCQSNGTGGGLWFNASTWTGCDGSYPNAADSAQILPGDFITVESDLTGYSVSEITIDAGAVLSLGAVSENLVVSGGLSINGTLELSIGPGNLEVGGDFSKGSSGGLSNNGSDVIFNGGTAQEISGSLSTSSNRFEKIVVENNSTVTFNNNLGVETGVLVEAGSTFQSDGSARLTQEVANEGVLDCDGVCVFQDLTVRKIDMSGSTGSIAVNGKFLIKNSSSIVVMPGDGAIFSIGGDFESNITSGTFDANGGTITLNGDATQTLDAAELLALHGLIVGVGTTLVEAHPAPNLSVVALTNNGTIRKAQTISGNGILSFGLTNVTMNVDSYSGNPTISVDRIDSDHPSANGGIAGSSDMFWDITASGAFQVDVVYEDPTVSNTSGQKTCRFNGTSWGCEADTDGAPGTTTRNNVTAFSAWQNCDGCGPTAITLQTFEANASSLPWKLVIALLVSCITILLHRFDKSGTNFSNENRKPPTINFNH